MIKRITNLGKVIHRYRVRGVGRRRRSVVWRSGSGEYFLLLKRNDGLEI